MLKISGVKGAGAISTKLKKDIFGVIHAAASQAITTRTRNLYDELRVMASAPPQTGVMRGGPGEDGNSIDTEPGLEVTGSSYGIVPPVVIGKRSGQLQSRLEKAVQNGRVKILGIAGFGTEIRPRGPVGRFDWPASKAIARSKIPGTRDDDPNKPRSQEEPPEVYIPSMILGTEKFYGRNILRMAIINDSVKGLTAQELKAALVKALIPYNDYNVSIQGSRMGGFNYQRNFNYAYEPVKYSDLPKDY